MRRMRGDCESHAELDPEIRKVEKGHTGNNPAQTFIQFFSWLMKRARRELRDSGIANGHYTQWGHARNTSRKVSVQLVPVRLGKGVQAARTS